MNKSVSIFLLCTIAGALLMIGCATGVKGTSEVTGDVTGAHPRFEALCSKCHTLDRVDQAHQAMTQEQMRSIIDRMARKPESGIDLNEIDDIVREIY